MAANTRRYVSLSDTHFDLKVNVIYAGHTDKSLIIGCDAGALIMRCDMLSVDVNKYANR
jgi:hypothetical protein